MINSYEDLVALLPWTRYPGNPIIDSPQPDSYVNLNPSSWIIDPLDSSKFLLYMGEFQGAGTNGKISLFTGYLNNPSALTLYGDVITPAMLTGAGISSTWGGAVYGNVVVSGSTVYYCFDTNPIGPIYIATSTDGGRTFTLNATPLLSPDEGEGEGGFETPFMTNYGGATWYLYFTVREPSPSYGFFGQDVATASSPTGPWTRQGVNTLPNGLGGSFASFGCEGAQYYKFGSDYIAIYNGFTGANFAIGLAYSSSPLSVFSADTEINPILHGVGGSGWESYGVVCPVLAIPSSSYSCVLFYGGFPSDMVHVNVGMVTVDIPASSPSSSPSHSVSASPSVSVSASASTSHIGLYLRTISGTPVTLRKIDGTPISLESL